MKLYVKSLTASALLGISALLVAGCGGGGGGSSSPSVTTSSSLSLDSPLQQNLFYPTDPPSVPAGTIQVTPPPARTVNSILSIAKINIAHFTSTFNVQLTAGADNGDGLTFVVENTPTTQTQSGGSFARGVPGGGLGYEGLGNSVAFKIDTHQNTQDPSANCVGVYLDGANPVGGDDVSNVLNFHNGDVFHVVLLYDGTNLTATVSDYGPTGAGLVPGKTFTKAYPVNIPLEVGASTAYAGFTAASTTASPQNIISWTMTSP